MSVDNSAALVEQVREAFESGTQLAIHGGGSKGFLGAPLQGQALDVTSTVASSITNRLSW